MKTLRVILASFFIFSGHLFAAETRDLILVAGQSNAVGFDAKPSDLPADPADKDILFWWRAGDPPPDEHDSTSGGKWTHLQPQPRGNPMQPRQGRQYGNFAQADGGFGPEIGLARALHAREGRRLAIVKAAFSGTAMAQDWNPADPGDGGSCYRALVAETKAAIAAAKARDITLRLRALAWVQGESDANATAAPLYEKALGDMIAALRRDLDAPQLIALLAVNTRFGGGKNTFMPAIIEAQKALASKLPRCAYVDTATATIANNVHFDAAGTLDVGRRFAETLMQCEVNAASPALFPGKRSEWQGFDRYDFEVAGKPVLVVAPKQALPGKPWAWRGEFFGAFANADAALVGRGFHLVYMRVPDMLGCPDVRPFWDAFYKELTEKYGFAKKTALIGLSRGGLYCYNWAIANPDKVACVYADAAVCDFKSWPGGKGKGKGSKRDWDLVMKVYHFASEAEALGYKGNPVDNLAPLAKAKVPLLHVYGDADDVVPWDENTGVVAERYKKLGGDITLIGKPGVSHHPHGLSDPTPIVEFIVKHAAKNVER
ncbi:MAG: hypothetical protein HZA91_08860 [Verrucomicrobia bacterium]|nr:hypothetical protein [Verrucomicrobiota bacterium]